MSYECVSPSLVQHDRIVTSRLLTKPRKRRGSRSSGKIKSESKRNGFLGMEIIAKRESAKILIPASLAICSLLVISLGLSRN